MPVAVRGSTLSALGGQKREERFELPPFITPHPSGVFLDRSVGVPDTPAPLISLCVPHAARPCPNDAPCPAALAHLARCCSLRMYSVAHGLSHVWRIPQCAACSVNWAVGRSTVYLSFARKHNSIFKCHIAITRAPCIPPIGEAAKLSHT
eukprot:scaffold230725_cov30-Tisochrysis_lutea.AAC.5